MSPCAGLKRCPLQHTAHQDLHGAFLLKGRGGSHTVSTLLLHCEEKQSCSASSSSTHLPAFWQLMYWIYLKKKVHSQTKFYEETSSQKNASSHIRLSTAAQHTCKPSPRKAVPCLKHTSGDSALFVFLVCNVPSRLSHLRSSTLLPLEEERARQAVHWPTLYIVLGSIVH